MRGVLIAFLLFSGILNAQDSLSVHQELLFGEHLLKSDLLDEAALHFGNLRQSKFDPAINDSINFFLGWTLYRQQSLLPSSQAFSKVSSSSGFYNKSQFFSAYNLTFEGDYASALKILDQEKASTINEELRHFERAGIYLLDRNLEAYKKEAAFFSGQYFAMSAEQERFAEYAQSISGIKRRSPFLAGVFSALLPGSGKIYAGKTRQGIAAFLPVAALGLQTWENSRKRGWEHPLTIAYAGLFSIFYVGNIWGSVLSVKIVNDETNEGIDQRILFDLHIPLRTIFAK